MTHLDLAAHARAIIDANLYLTLGTTDPDGYPWTSPVYFAPAGDRKFYWMSATDARHSCHVAARPRVSMVIFDSTVLPYHGRAVCAIGEARELSGKDQRRRAHRRASGWRCERHASPVVLGRGAKRV
jgi:nitroimidazol reductase NimA-like FMN-containing flavoprotein (pyridoxamine 5'-phosphate oxidase superfamily)